MQIGLVLLQVSGSSRFSIHTQKDRMARDLSRFTAIAVRDTNSQAIVEKQIGKKVPITLDPTLAYDFEGDTETVG